MNPWTAWLEAWRLDVRRVRDAERVTARRPDRELVDVVDLWGSSDLGWSLDEEPWTLLAPDHCDDPWSFAWSVHAPLVVDAFVARCCELGLEASVARARFHGAIFRRLIEPDGSVSLAGSALLDAFKAKD